MSVDPLIRAMVLINGVQTIALGIVFRNQQTVMVMCLCVGWLSIIIYEYMRGTK